jgi:hypothetical protein
LPVFGHRVCHKPCRRRPLLDGDLSIRASATSFMPCPPDARRSGTDTEQ